MKSRSVIALAGIAAALGVLTATAFAHVAYSGHAAGPVVSVPAAEIGAPQLLPARKPWWTSPMPNIAGTSGGTVFVNGIPR
jgi:hypothetical protein